jgi:hypothetical protein
LFTFKRSDASDERDAPKTKIISAMPATAAHRFTLEKYHTPASRHTCPQCGKRREFTLYVDARGEVELPANVGKCNREMNCGYHYTPRQYFKDAGICFDRQGNIQTGSADAPRRAVSRPQPTAAPVPTASHIDHDIFRQSIAGFERNNFAKFLRSKFGQETADAALTRYYVGTSRHWQDAGATVFWQVDISGKVRTGKVMLYDPDTGKRDKSENRKPTWVHALLRLPDFHLQQCFFGEHLLSSEPGKAVAVIEAEKTAVVASVYFARMNYLWLATGGKNFPPLERWEVLRGRRVVLFPDTGQPKGTDTQTPFERWSAKADELRKAGFQVAVSDLLERRASADEREAGADLADYLLRFDLADFQPSAAAPDTTPAPIAKSVTAPKNDRETLARMIQKNPAVTELIARFDLELYE